MQSEEIIRKKKRYVVSTLRVQLHFLQERGFPPPKALLMAKGRSEQAVVSSETE